MKKETISSWRLYTQPLALQPAEWGGAEVNLVARTSAPFAAADGERNAQPEL